MPENMVSRVREAQDRQAHALLFGMEDFVRGLKETLDEHFARVDAEGLEPLVIGVMGQWRSGKSSVLRRVEALLRTDLEQRGFRGARALRAAAKEKPAPAIPRLWRRFLRRWRPEGEGGPATREMPIAGVVTIPVFFNPWRYEQEAHLIVPLLKTTKFALSRWSVQAEPVGRGVAGFLKDAAVEVRDAALVIGSGLSLEVSVLGLDKLSLDLHKVRTADAALQAHRRGQPPPLGSRYESIYYDILQHLRSITRPPDQDACLNLVFVVDDLDRCLPEKAVQMLEAIKLFLDVPGCAFVLGLDEAVVERGIAHRYRDYNRQGDRATTPWPTPSTPSISASISFSGRTDLGPRHLRSALQGRDVPGRRAGPRLGTRYLLTPGAEQATALAREGFDERRLIASVQSPKLSNRERRAASRLPDDLDVFLPVADDPFLFGEEQVETKLGHAFWIAKYPATNAQFARFIDDGGYARDELWDDSGKDWREGEQYLKSPRFWKDRQSANPLFPVVGVTCHEARAYARWLDAELRKDPGGFGLEGVSEGYAVRLPTEREWERAARGTDGREYPWGQGVRDRTSEHR